MPVTAAEHCSHEKEGAKIPPIPEPRVRVVENNFKTSSARAISSIMVPARASSWYGSQPKNAWYPIQLVGVDPHRPEDDSTQNRFQGSGKRSEYPCFRKIQQSVKDDSAQRRDQTKQGVGDQFPAADEAVIWNKNALWSPQNNVQSHRP